MASRLLTDLYPAMQEKAEVFLEKTSEIKLDVLIYCTWRNSMEQNTLFAQGRDAAGQIIDRTLVVTNCRGGQSAHNFMLGDKPAALAFDCVPLVGGKAMWMRTHPAWQLMGAIGAEVGLEWAGKWPSFSEYPHFQMPHFDARTAEALFR